MNAVTVMEARRIRTLVAMGIAVVAIASCQTPAPRTEQATPQVTLKQAKEITASFERPSYTRPRRAVDDVLEHIGEPEAVTGSECTQRRAKERARSRRALELADDIAIAEYGGDTGYSWRSSHYLNEQHRLYREGQVAQSNRVVESILKFVPQDWAVERSAVWSILSTRYAESGDLAQARSAWSRTRRNLSIGRSQRHEWPNAESAMDFHETISRAVIADLQGEYANAERNYREAFRLSLVVHPSYAIDPRVVLSLLAKTLGHQGRHMEAEVEGRRAVTMFHRPSPKAGAVTALSEVIYEQGRYEDAERLSALALRMHDSACVPGEELRYALARAAYARSLAAQDNWETANEQFDALRLSFGQADPETYRRRFAGDVDMGLSLLKTGRLKEGLQTMELAYAQASERLGEVHYETAMALGFVGLARLAVDDLGGAREAFLGSVPRLIEGRQQAASAARSMTTRERRLRSVLEAYMELLERVRGGAHAAAFPRDVVAEMFKIADVARSGSVQRAVAAASARAVADPELAALVRQEQDAKQQVEALQALVLDMRSHDKAQSDPEVQDVAARLRKAIAARRTLLSEIERRFPDYAARVNPKAGTVGDAKQALGPNEALIATYVAEEQTYVWAVPKSGGVTFSVAPLGRKALSGIVRSLRRALDSNATTLGEIPEFDIQDAYRLYASLLAPVQAGWRNADTLVVVAHDALGQLPLGVLPTEAVALGAAQAPLFSRYRAVPWLAKSHAVAVVPSVAVFREQRSAGVSGTASKPFIGFGDPWFSKQVEKAEALASADLASSRGVDLRGLAINLRAPVETRAVSSAELARLPRLPETADEVRSIAKVLGADLERDVFLGPAANERNVYEQPLEQYRVLAFATHGLVPGDLNGLLQPALALSAPEVAQVKGDGLLTLEEVLSLKLDADWVVLSACNTAAADGAGSEAVSGLGRAFFYAGARSLLVTHWPVETTSAKALTTEVFRLQSETPSLTRAQALRQAMVALIDGPGYVDSATDQSLFSYAHPLFWAPFALVGDGAN